MINRMENHMSLSDHDTCYGKMFPVHSQAEKETTLHESLKKQSKSLSHKSPLCKCLKVDGTKADATMMSWEDGALLGEYTTRSFGECPKEENASHFAQILEDSVLPKYYLSVRACSGILRRFKERNKELPQELKDALERQIIALGGEL